MNTFITTDNLGVIIAKLVTNDPTCTSALSSVMIPVSGSDALLNLGDTVSQDLLDQINALINAL